MQISAISLDAFVVPFIAILQSLLFVLKNLFIARQIMGCCWSSSGKYSVEHELDRSRMDETFKTTECLQTNHSILPTKSGDQKNDEYYYEINLTAGTPLECKGSSNFNKSSPSGLEVKLVPSEETASSFEDCVQNDTIMI